MEIMRYAILNDPCSITLTIQINPDLLLKVELAPLSLYDRV